MFKINVFDKMAKNKVCLQNRKRSLRGIVCALMVCFGGSNDGWAHGGSHGNTHVNAQVNTYKKSGLEFTNPTIRPAKKGQNAAAYFQINNSSNRARVIQNVQCEWAEKIELHESVEKNGIFKMVKQKQFIIPARGKLELKSGGHHIMMIRLKKDLKSHDKRRKRAIDA